MKDHIHTAAYHNSGVRREISRCYPGTRETALETISNWIKNPTSHCLWLHGPAGTGKSSIAYTVAEKCRLDGTLGATYFFIRGTTSGRPPFFSTLAYQLTLAVPDLRDPLWAMLCEDPTVFDRSMSEQLDKLIVQPFLRLARRPAHVVIVIDGLDECDCTGGAAIQADIARLVLGLGEHSLPLRFVISSRPEPEIRHAFESSPRSLVGLTHLALDKTLDPDCDIRHFLCKELERVYRERVEDGIRRVASQTTWPPPEVVERIVEKSSGHFIYASTVIKFVQEENVNPMERLDAVLHISDGSAGPSVFVQSASFQELDQLYLHILRKAGDPAVLRRILRAIMYFNAGPAMPRRILPHNMYFNADQISVENLDLIFSHTGGVHFLLRGLRSIIEVTAASMVRFWHASLSDFLMDLVRSRGFYYDRSQFQADLACEYTRLIVL
ncbi:hypothetical protein BD779DRAFT_1452926 [Infundibulicybe gibba]|nr:hypothetical protein BD779DRAFT_1452926 [Infundibulicybe gibba]